MASAWGYFVDLIGKIAAKDLLMFLIAAYGAILSTIVLVYSITRERRRIVIKHAPGFFGYPSSGETGPTMACLEVVNEGHRPVVISAPAILTPKSGSWCSSKRTDSISFQRSWKTARLRRCMFRMRKLDSHSSKMAIPASCDCGRCVPIRQERCIEGKLLG